MSRGYGEGSITQRKDGRWQAALMVGGVRKTVYGKTRGEALRKLGELRRQAAANGALPDPGRRTVGDLVVTWLELAESSMRPKTLADYRWLCQKYILPALGPVRLARLEPVQVERLLAGIQARGHVRMAQRVRAMLHRACGLAVRWRWLSENPIERVQPVRYCPGTRALWSSEQVAAFLRAILDGQGGRYGPLLGFLLASGCRVGEALGLRWSDVDFEAGTVRIERQVTELRSRPIEGLPKTLAGLRTVALPAWGLALLRRRWLQALVEGQAGRVFCTERGTVPLQGNVRRALTGLCAKLGLPRVRVHDLRHISLSLLAMAGVPLKAAQARAGHSTSRMTLDVYQHVLGDEGRAAAQAPERALGERR